MSIAHKFEERRVPVPMAEWSEHGTFKFWGDDVEYLLKHTRKLEAMLKKHEWSAIAWGSPGCPECMKQTHQGHAPDCELAKLLGDGEASD